MHFTGVIYYAGYPEIAYSFRKQMGPLAAAGFHVIAMDHRCVGRTTGCNTTFSAPQANYSTASVAKDALALVQQVLASSFGTLRSAVAIGSDYGSGVACTAAQNYPRVFTAVVHMSAPHGAATIGWSDAELALLDPPRKHYQAYYRTPEANADMVHAPAGLHDFIRGYMHFKSADWKGTRGVPATPGHPAIVGDMPHHLNTSQTPPYKAFAELPRYYVMLKSQNMAQGVADAMPTAEEIRTLSNRWLPEGELAVFVEEFRRTGFQGGLNWYRGGYNGDRRQEQAQGKAPITVPGVFIGGKAVWGVFQSPGAFESAPASFSDWRGAWLVDGAGHWLPQEQPEVLNGLLLRFLAETA